MNGNPAIFGPAIIGQVALIGYGEAGQTFARSGDWAGALVHDLKADRRAAAIADGLTAPGEARAVLAGASLVLCLVTADQALAAARSYAPMLAPGAVWCDMNSVAPETKRAAAEVIMAAGGLYADVAVLAPVNPARMHVPLLLAGEVAARAGALLGALGFDNIRVVGAEVGRASAIKMIRSVMVKGLEALTAEMVLAGHKAGVLDEVLGSLDASEKAVPWAARANYNLDRMLVHGARRAAEMYEASQTLQSLGVSPMMTDNTVNWQQALGDLHMAPLPDSLEDKLAAITQSAAFKGEI